MANLTFRERTPITLLVIASISLLAGSARAQWTSLKSGTNSRLRGLCVVSDNVVWASGARGTFVRTVDGGVTWRAGVVPGAADLDFRDVHAFDGLKAFLLSIGEGEKSRIYQTVDGGASWTIRFRNTDPKVFLDAIAFWDADHGIALGDPVDGKFTIITTQDGGESWQCCQGLGIALAMRRGYHNSSPDNPLSLLRSHRHGRRNLLRDGSVEASARRRGLAYSPFHVGGFLVDGPLERKRGSCYTKLLEFGTLARLVAEALTQHGGSGRQAFERGQESNTLEVSIGSAFAKLGNLPLPLSETLLWEGTQRLEKILPEKPAVDPFPLPACWKRHEVFGIDGKAIKHVKRLLKPLRGLQAGILGGRASVALNLRTGLAVGMLGDLDGEAGEGLLSEGLLSEMAAAADGKPWVVVLDRLYCNLGFPRRVLDAGGHFLIRYCSNTHFVADPARPAQTSRDAKGQQIVQEWGRLGKSAGPRALYVRRITLHLACGTVISVVTDLLDEAAYPADALLVTYRKRWGIERVFHQITDVFSLKNLIGTSPKAVLFQLSFCLLLYNTLQVLRTHLAFHQECEAEKISNEKLFYDLKRELVAVDELVENECLLELLGEAPTAGEFRAYLQQNLRGVWSNRWWKAPSSGGGGHKKVKTRVLGNHTSTYRVFQQAKT